MSNIME